MSEEIGALRVALSAATATFERDMRAAREIAKRNAKGMENSMNGARKAFEGFSQGVSSAKRALVGISAAVGGIYALKKAWDVAEEAARFQQMEKGFENLARSHGANAQNIIKNLKEMSGETISTANIMQSAGKALLLGIPADQLDQLMRIARSSAKVTGQSVQAAFDDIATGLGRQSKLILDNLGIIVNVEKAYKDYAATLNKASSDLSDAERKQAFTNATIEAGQEIVRRVGNEAETAAEKVAKFDSKMEDLKITLGQKLIPIMTALIDQFISWGKAVGAFEKTPIDKIADISAEIKRLSEHFDKVEKSWLGSRLHMGEVLKEIGELEKERANLLEVMLKSEGAAGHVFITTAKKVEEASEAIKDAAPDIASSFTALFSPNNLKLSLGKTGLDVTIGKHLSEAMSAAKEKVKSEDLTFSMQTFLNNPPEESLELIEKARRIIEDTLTPMELLNKKMVDLREMLSKGLIEPEIYERAAEDAEKKFTDSFKKTAKEGDDRFKELKQSIEGWGRASADTFADFAMSGKASFSDLANSIIKDMLRMAAYKMVFGPMFNGISDAFFGPSTPPGGAPVDTSGPSMFAAHGKAFDNGRVIPFAKGGVINRPTTFPLGLAGEAGPEAILPLARIGGDLGVRADMGGLGDMNIKFEIINKGGEKLAASDSKITMNAQDMVVTLWLDAYERNKGGLRSLMGG